MESKQTDSIAPRTLANGKKDIAYQGPLSYRHLRIIGWIGMIIAAMISANSISRNSYPLFNNEIFKWLASDFSLMSTPLLMLAAFSFIFRQKDTYWGVMKNYLILCVAIILGFSFLYSRYLVSLLGKFGMPQAELDALLKGTLVSKASLNPFTDLLCCSSFALFLNYRPKKTFKGKLIILFRMLAILPIAYEAASYTLRVLDMTQVITLPAVIYPILCNKSPLLFTCFAIIIVFTKFRKIIYCRKYDASTYEDWLGSNRETFSFSVLVSIVFFIAGFLDIIGGLISIGLDPSGESVTKFGFGSFTGFFMVIPLVMLFSYKKNYDHTKNKSLIDLIIPVSGVALVVLTYIEGFYEGIMAAA